MREIYTLVLSVCALLLGVEILANLFPEKSGSLVHTFAVLAVVLSLVGGIFNIDFDSVLANTDFSLSADTEEAEPLYAKTGVALLRERLCALLDASGITVENGEDGVEVWYTQDDDGSIQIDRVRVCVSFASDTDRAYAVLRSALTEAVPLEVFTA